MDSHGATFEYTKYYYWEGYKVFGHIFLEGDRIFGLLT